MLVNDALSGGQVKGRLPGFGVQASVHEEVLAILPADFFPGDGIRVAQKIRPPPIFDLSLLVVRRFAIPINVIERNGD